MTAPHPLPPAGRHPSPQWGEGKEGLTDHLQESLDPCSELADRARRIDILQMKKRNMDGLIVGFSCGDFKAKGITIFVYIKNGAVYLEFFA